MFGTFEERLAYSPECVEDEFSEVQSSKFPNSGRALWRRGGAVRGCCCLLATRSPRKQRGIVASGHRLFAFQTRGLLGLDLPPESPPGPPLCALLRTSRSGVGLLGAPASILLLLAALVSPHRSWHEQVDVVSYAAKFMGLSETGGRGGVGAIGGFVNRSRRRAA